MVGNATFVDLIKGIRGFTPAKLNRALGSNLWETAGFFILVSLFSVFEMFWSQSFLYAMVGFYWCWALGKPELLKKSQSKRYRLSLLKFLFNFERSLRFIASEVTEDRVKQKRLSRLISLVIFSGLISLLVNKFFVLAFIGGGLSLEFFRLVSWTLKNR